MSKQPSDAAMKAALRVVQLLRIELHEASKSAIKAQAEIARALDAFAEAAVRDEIESIRGWLGVYASDSVVRQFDEDNKRGAK